MKGKTRTIVAFAVLTALLIGWPVAAHYRAVWRLRDYKRELRGRGEKLEVAELIPRLPVEGANGASDLTLASSRLNSMAGSGSNYPPVMRCIAPSRAVVAWQQDVLPTPDSTNVWPGLRSVIAENREALADIRAALEKPALVFDQNYKQGFNILLLHLPRVKGAAQSLSAATLLDLREGRTADAVANLQALAAMVARFKDEPLMISELVRIAIAAIAINASWEALQSSQLSESDLRELQRTWASVDFLSQAEAALAMERAMGERTFAAGRESCAALAGITFMGAGGTTVLDELAQLSRELLVNPRAGLSTMVHRYPGYWGWRWWQSYDDELANAQVTEAALEAIRDARKTHALAPALKKFGKALAEIQQAHPRAGVWLGDSLARGVITERFLARISICEMQRSLLQTAIALRRCQIRRGALPDNLESLLPAFTDQPLLDAMDGKPQRYHLKPDNRFVLYSVGEDGVDNGGDPTPPKEAVGAFRQWWKGRDAVWPSPASSEEVKAHFNALSIEDYGVRRRYGPMRVGPPPPATAK